MNTILDTKNKGLIAHFYKWLGSRFAEIHEASENAPITCLCTDDEGKEYYVSINYNEKMSSSDIELTGIKIENVTFYQLYSMVSEGLSVFHFEAFQDGYCLWFLNDCTPESIKVVDEYTLIGISSCLHHEMPQQQHIISKPVQNNIVLPTLPRLDKMPTVTGSFNSFNN
jgi:hypothetical protein